MKYIQIVCHVGPSRWSTLRRLQGHIFLFFFNFFFGSRATCHLCPDHYIVLYNVGILGRVLGCGTHSTISSDENQNLTSEISTECEPLPDLPVV